MFCSEVLALAQTKKFDVVFSPSETTWAIQLTDDGRGKALRNMIMEKFDAFLENFDFAATKGSISASEKRKLTARFTQEAVAAFASSEHETENTIAAAWRTGGRMEIDSNFDKIKPNRFPDDFGASILPGHPNHGRAKPYVPLFLGLSPVKTTTATPTPATMLASTSGGTATIQGTIATVTGGSASVRFHGGHHGVVVQGGSVSLDLATADCDCHGRLPASSPLLNPQSSRSCPFWSALFPQPNPPSLSLTLNRDHC